MAKIEDIQVGKLFRHKGGKLYKIDSYGGNIRWGQDRKGEVIWNEARTCGHYPEDRSKVYATQWQVNEKYPEGREYQASRELKLTDLTAI